MESDQRVEEGVVAGKDMVEEEQGEEPKMPEGEKVEGRDALGDEEEQAVQEEEEEVEEVEEAEEQGEEEKPEEEEEEEEEEEVETVTTSLYCSSSSTCTCKRYVCCVCRRTLLPEGRGSMTNWMSRKNMKKRKR